jgi:hypothetical protein
MLAAQCKEIHHVATLLNLTLALEMTKLVGISKDSVGKLNTINLPRPLVKLPKVVFTQGRKQLIHITAAENSNLRR